MSDQPNTNDVGDEAETQPDQNFTGRTRGHVPAGLVGQKIGSYELVEVLGQGGMGTVFRAHDTALEREVALKVMRPELAEGEGLERFLREARALAALNHPHLLQIYTIGQAGELGGLPFFVAELIAGCSLHQLLREKGAPALDEAMRIMGQLLLALSSAHAAGIVHRDLKPANVMIRADNGRVVLMDFGIAKLDKAAGLTTEGVVLGTPEYMSPEQAEGTAVDHRSDVYSLGIMLYELVVGRTPFQGKSAFSILRQQVDTPPRPPSETGADCPPALEAAILRCLQKQPADRYPSAAALAADLIKVHPTRELQELVADGQSAPPPADLQHDTSVSTQAETLDRVVPPTAPTQAEHPQPPLQPKGRLWVWLAAAAAAIVLMILIGIVANEDGGAPEEPPPNTAEPPVAAQPAGTPGRLRLPGSELQQARILSIQPMENGRLRVRYVPDGASEPVEDVIAMPEDAAVDVDLRSESAAEDP